MGLPVTLVRGRGAVVATVAVWVGLVVLGWVEKGPEWAHGIAVLGLVLALEIALLDLLARMYKSLRMGRGFAPVQLLRLAVVCGGLVCCWIIDPGGPTLVANVAIALVIASCGGILVGRCIR